MLHRFDLYSQVHRGLRLALSHLCHQAGSVDFTEEEKVNAFIEEFRNVTIILEAHSHDEDTHLNDSYQKFAPSVLEQLEAEHSFLDEKLEQLIALVNQLEASAPQSDERKQLWYVIGKSLNRFAAEYLNHLQTEEGPGMHALWENLTDDELKVLSQNIRSSIPPQTMVIFMHYMIPSLSHRERVEIFSEMKKLAPKEVLTGMLGIAEARLDATSWKSLQLALEQVKTEGAHA